MGLIIYLISVSLLAALLGYFVVLVFGQVRGSLLASRSAELERNQLQARIDQIMDQRHAERRKHELLWNGFRKFRVVRKVPESRDIASFYLSPHDGKDLPPFRPGQYLTFQLNVSERGQGTSAATRPAVRCYSLSDGPDHPESYRVTIKRTPPPRDKPDMPPGLVSNFFHDQVKEGDILDVKAPSGQFYLDLTTQAPVVLVAGGVGITPVLSMLNAIVESGSKRETWFFYGVRNSAEQIMRQHLERVAIEHDNVHMHVCYSNPTDQEVEGQDYHHGERVGVALFKRLLPSSNYDFYICGPPPMMDTITHDLTEWGVPKSSVHFEAFGPATVKKLKPAEAAPAADGAVALQVTFAKSGKDFAWKPGMESLLDFAEEHGITIDSGCRAGNCGTCLTAIKSGEVECRVESGAKPEDGSCLTCISIPTTDLVLDA